MSYKVVIDGFNTKEEAIAWAKAFEGGIEQNFEDIGENISAVSTDMVKYHEQGGFFANSNNEVIVPVKVHYDMN